MIVVPEPMQSGELLPTQRPLKILIDGYYIDSNRGMGRYIREVLDSVGRHMPDAEIHVLAPKSAVRRVQSDRLTYYTAPNLPFPLWEQILLPMFAWRGKFDVVHSPYNTFPLLCWFNKSHVVTVHDLMFFKSDFETMSARQNFGRLYRKFIVCFLKKSKVGVTTMTHTVADEISAILGRTAAIHRTPVSFFISNAREDIATPERFVLHVGGAVPHKNTLRAVEAFRRAALPGRKLVVLGIRSDHALAAECASPDVIFPGWLSDGQILTHYDRAEAVIFPSLMEGYGLPLLEGMACGSAVITSNRNPMMELVGDAAMLVDPLDEDAMAQAIRTATLDADARAKLLANGRVRIGEFTSERLARSLEAIYRACARAKTGES